MTDSDPNMEAGSRGGRRRRRNRRDGAPAPVDGVGQDLELGPDVPETRQTSPEERALPEPPDDDAPGDATFYRFSSFLGVLALVILAGALVLYSVAASFTREVGALLVVAVVLAVLWAIPRFDELLSAFSSRTARQGSNATLMSVAFIGLLVVGNWLANRHSGQWDLTAAKRFSLSDQTAKIVDRLDRDVQVTAFLPGQDDNYTRGAKDLLRLYDRRSDRVSVQFIDPDREPGVAQQFGIRSYTTVFQMGDRREETTGVTEQDFTSALLKLTRTGQKKVYFVTGHQERDIDGTTQTGYSQMADALKRENYALEKLLLLSTQRVPEDAAVVVLAGPRTPLLDPERQALQEYLDRGGHLFFLAEPRVDAGLGDLLQRWNVQLNADVVVDPVQYLGDPLSPVPQPQAHRIASSLSVVALPAARSLTLRQVNTGDLAVAPLLRTTDRAWGETSIETTGPIQPQFTQGEDLAGPLVLAAAVNKTDPTPSFTPGAPSPPTPPAGEKQPRGRLVVIGNAEFASNTYVARVLGNRDFFVNSINWLAEDEDLISIRSTPNDSPPIVLTNQSQVLVLYASVIFLPLAVLLIGGVIWWQRR